MVKITPELCKMVRHARNESMEQFASYIGCAYSTYIHYESEHRNSRLVPDLIGQKFSTGQLLQAQRTIEAFNRTSDII